MEVGKLFYEAKKFKCLSGDVAPMVAVSRVQKENDEEVDLTAQSCYEIIPAKLHCIGIAVPKPT